MSKSYRFTVFPSLHPKTTISVTPITLTASIDLPEHCANDTIVLAWSYLLHGHCATDTAVFRVDGAISGAEFNDGKLEWISEGVVDASDGGRWTGVYFTGQPSGIEPQLYLTVDIIARRALLHVSSELVPESYPSTLSAQFLHILNSLLQSPFSKIQPFPSGGLSVLNPSPIRLPGPSLLHQLIRFSGHGDKTALDFLHADGTQSTYSYAQLDILSTKFAVKLTPHLHRSKMIPVLLRQSPDLYIALLGILKAGAAFVPLPLDAPVERIRFVVTDVQAACIVTHPELSSIFSWEACPPTVTLEDDVCTFSLEGLLGLPGWIDDRRTAYVMYTSGTTGTPKGVAVSHRAATQSLLAHERHIPLFTRWLQFAAPTFDVFVFEMFFPLVRGTVLVGCERGRLLRDLPEAVREMEVDAVELTPTVAGGLLGLPEGVPGLKVLLTIGEMLTAGVVEAWGGGVLQGMYGPTEAAIHCTLAGNFEREAKVGDVGVPFDTVSAFIIAPYKGGEIEVLPVGWIGELAVGGWQLADGYVGRPEQTREVFIDSKRYGRLYRTGDRARILPAGRIECLGRVGAGQVKLRGQRVELGEVEEVVLKTPGTKGCVANVVDSTMVVWVGGGVKKTAIIDVCKRWLPGFMVPGDIVVFDELPRLASGKADRKRLEKEYRERIVEVEEEDMESGERVIAGEVERLLGVAPGRCGSLIALGLDSIQAIRLVSALRSKGFKIEVVDVLKADTVAGIAEVIGQIKTTPQDTNEAVLKQFKAVEESTRIRLPKNASDIEKIIPCTSIQSAMLAETARDSSVYCNWILLSLPQCPAAVVEKALRAIIDANEILRTGFAAVDDGFAQIIYRSSRPAQFSVGVNVEAEWSITMDALVEPPFRATLVHGELSIQIHHALYDGWCWEQVMADFATLLEGRTVATRPQYEKVVERELARPPRAIEESMAYWKSVLDGFDSTTLQCLNERADVVAEVGGESSILTVGRREYDAAARALGVSPQTIIQTAWAFLWSFYIGSADAVFGSVVSGRTVAIEGIEDVIGPTILTLPVRVNVGRERVVRDVIADLAKRGREMLAHEVGLREVKKAWGGEGALFESLLVWQQTLMTGEGSVKVVDARDRLEFAILIEVEPGVEGINLRATYQSAILPQAQVKLMLSQLDQFVSGIISQPDQTLASLQSTLTEDVLAVENPNPSVPPITDTPSLVDLVERAVARTPNTIAVEFANDIVDGVLDSTKLTYAQLNSQANKLAYHLLSLGIVSDELVCVCMEKSPALYISILAILKAGAAYVPVTPETPKERISHILTTGDMKLCLTTSDLEKTLGVPEGVKTVLVDSVNVRWYSGENPDVERSGEKLAYAVFTSGSTGVPKGVLVDNSAVVNNILVLQGVYPVGPGSRMLQSCTIAFDVSVFEIFFTWSMGMTLCSGSKDILLRDIEGAINVLRTTHLSMTPTVAALVNPDNVPCVEFLVTAGETVTPKVFGDWVGRGFYMGYGPSETVNICTARLSVSRKDNIKTIGEPLATTSAFIFSDQDEELSLVPKGGLGELCIGGAQLARGYLKMPELTNRKFITHPKYGRIYRTGDICRMLWDGSIDFVGRIDDQTKIRGHRIELGEINSILLKSDMVLHAATMPIQRQEMDSYQLVAFVLLKGHQDHKFAVLKSDEVVRKALVDLFTKLGNFLPPYMVPSVIVPVTSIPLMGTGKADKKAMERIYLDMDSSILESYSETFLEQDGDNRNWTAVEEEIINIIADVARVTVGEVGRNTSIFKLGLDSISAIQLSNRIMKAGFTRLDVSQIMKNPTVGALATLLEDGQPTVVKDDMTRDVLLGFAKEIHNSALEQLGISVDEVIKILPCTPLQEAMLAQKKGVDARTYYNHTVLNLKADPVRLRDAWMIMVERHDIMRTCFCVTSDSRHAYAQVVLKNHELPWATFELEATQELIDERIVEVSSSLSTIRTPYAFSLFLSSTGATLIMSFHHSLYDGFAMDLLLEDVRRAYYGLELPTRRPFDPVLEYMENIDLEAADKFWADMLAGLEPSSFPDLTGKTTSFKKETKLTGMSSARITCSRSLSSVEEGCRSLSTSLLALGQTGWARLLSVYSGETDLCFGSVVSGRTISVEGVEDIIAPCFNTVPLRVQLTPSATNITIMDSIQRINADILPYQLTPLRRIMNTMRTEGHSLFDTLFILQHAHQSSFADLWEEVEDRGEMDFSVVVELVPSRNKNSLDIVLHFRRDFILEEHADILLGQLNEAIIASLEHPLELAADFSTFDPALLSTANIKPLIIESDGYDLLHSDFERHAHENPSHSALEFLDTDGKISTWTFETLNQAANQVAHYLISLGLKQDDAVPLCLEKSPIFYICVLGVLKAGCAFTPIDPTLPSQRKLFMLQELGAKIVFVTDATANDLDLPIGVKKVNIEYAGLLASQPITNPNIPNLSPQCLAYRLYTSGSTGQPKAVSLEIKSAVQTFRASKTLIPWKVDSRLLQFAATTFDMCYYDCFMAWSYGFTLCSAAKKHLLGDLEGTIKTLNATLLDLTPTVASTLIAENLPTIETLYCIGEAMPQKLVNDWDGRCLNSYGPTEAAMCCTIMATSKEIKSSNIGKPFPTASFIILSRDGEYMVPTFGSGELCIGGPQVAREYHNNTKLTMSQFIQIGQDTVYRTGDIVRMLGDGTFEFIGRADDQVKIRGLRVELDEISSVLRGGHSYIKDTTTIVVRHNENAKEQLVSFLATEGRKQHGTPTRVLGVSSKTEEIQSASREAARIKLPRYMIPAVILVIDHIPLSAAGKVDKKSLGALFKEQDIQSFGASNFEDEDESMWTEEERKIRDVFSQISRVPVEQISRASTIYEIGLDSISAAQVAMQLKRAGLQISVLDILERPSINQLSILLTPGTSTVPNSQISDDLLSGFSDQFLEPVSSETGIAKENIDGVFPCTPAQEGMLSQFLRSKGGLYFNHVVFGLPQNIDFFRLQKSWDAVFSSHDMLRAGFAEVDDARHSFATIVHRQGSVTLPLSTVDSWVDSDKDITTQKQLNTSRALERLYLPPWSVTVFKKQYGSCLLFSAHHALYDAQSLSLVLDDVFSEYSGCRISPRPQFSAVLTTIMKHTLDSKVLEDDKSFWIKQLQGTSISRFPNLCPVRVKSTASHVSSIETNWTLSELESGCRKLGISMNAVGQAAWAKVLSAYMGDNAVTMGIVLSGRSGVSGAEDVAFPCIATVPSLCLLTGTNLELALALQQSNAQMLKHQHTPLRTIQSWFDHPQESFFDSIFVYQKTGSSRKNLSSLLEVIEEDAFVDYTISLEIEPTDMDSLLVRVTCRENVVPKEQMQLLLSQFEAALIDILQNPNSSSTEFSNFPPALLSCTPAKVDEIPTDINLLHKFVEKYRHLTPDKVAFEFATSIQEGCAIKETWTYTQLDEEGNRIANYLLQLGVKTGEIVGICFEKCPEASFAILGILKAGCAFLALDYNAPIDRKAFIIEDSGAKCLLTMDKFAIELRSKLKVHVVALESDTEVKLSSSDTPVVLDLTPEDLCYCLYTSGTTGTPKGCELTHENAIQAMLAFQRLFGGHWDAESRFLQFASFHFDVSVLEQYWSWSVGVCVTSAPRDVIFQDLALTINELQITHLDLTPSLAALLRPEDVPSLCRGVFITGGEQLKQEILDTWGATGVIYNGYGPTEVTIGCTMYPRVPANGKPSNIGPQFDNVGSFVFAPGTNRPVLRGAIGELCVSGKLVGRGYLNRPSLTEERFPYLKEFDTRIYRTGDLVRILYDGTFDFTGRADDQVKLRGQRLEIGEINETLKQADSRVKAVATLVLRHPKQQKDQLVSFIVLGTSDTSNVSEPVVLDNPGKYQIIPILADGCRRKLPVYMVPTHFLPISKMPLSVNNKVDNKKLTAIYHETSLALLQQISRREEVHEENWTDAEKRIQKVLADMTGFQASEIKRSSTVFELGLDSVSVVGLARRLKKDGFFASSVSLVMQYPSIKQLAVKLSNGDNNSSQELARMESINQKLAAFANKGTFEVCERLELETDQIEAIVPCTALQEGMILRFIDSEKPLYYNSFSLSLDKSINVNLLHNAWDMVVKSTSILRTSFCETSDGYAQVVLKDSPIQWHEIHVEDDEEVQSVISTEMMKHTNINKDLHQTPLYLLLLRTPSRTITVVNIFHALYDGNSLPLILQDVQSAYRNQLKARSHQFFEIAGHILSVDMDSARKFWKANLAEVKKSTFPQLSHLTTHSDHLMQLKPKIAIGDVEKFCRQLGCTPQAVFQSAWASVLSPYLGPQFAFGVVVSGRSLPMDSVEDIIGPMFNTIPCSLDTINAYSWEKLVQQAHLFNSESIPYHHTPLRLINKLMRVSSEKPLFDTLFVYQKVFGDREATGTPIWEIIDSSTIADYPLALEIEESFHDGLTFSIVAKGSVLANNQSLELLHSLEKQIHDILQNPHKKPSLGKGHDLEKIASTVSTNETYTNGGNSGFQWGPEANVLRSTIAKLADVGESEVDEDSSIFELGLDSIEAIKLSSRLRSNGIRLSVSTLMRNPTIRKLQSVLAQSSINNKTLPKGNRITEFEQHIRQELKGQKHSLNLDQIEAIYPTTPLQEGMIAETLASNYSLYFNHDVMELSSEVDLGLLKVAWELVFQKSEILRTSFFHVAEITNDLPYTFGQAVHKRPQLNWNEVLLPSEENTMRAIKDVMQQASENVNMLQEPPLRITILRTPTTRYLILSISHALYDGCSLGLLHEDIQNAYYGVLPSRPSCRLLLEDIFNTDLKDSQKFWKQMLTGASPSTFKVLADEAAPATTHRFEMQSSLTFLRIQTFCKKIGVTVQSLGQTCWALLLAHYLGDTDILFGTVLSGRDFDSADKIVFPAMNTVPVRAIVHGDYKDMLRYMQDNSARVLKYQHTPLRQIQKLIEGQGQRLFDTLFIYQRGREPSKSDKKPLWHSIEGASDVEYNVCIEMEHSGENLVWRNACKSTTLTATDSENVLHMLDSLLTHIVNNTSHPCMTYRAEGISFGNIPMQIRRQTSIANLNGLRIDLDQTATIIQEGQKNIEDSAAIIAKEHGRNLLVVFFTGYNSYGEPIAEDQNFVQTLATFARQAFPHWSIPSFIIPISKMPYKNSKIDRAELESYFNSIQPDKRDRFAIHEQTNEWSPLELTFRRILSGVSRLPEVEIERNQTIFHLGLDSISAIGFSSALRKESIFLSVAEILRAATIERMAMITNTANDETLKVPVDTENTLKKALKNIDTQLILGGIPEDSIESIAPGTSGQVYMLSTWKNSNYTLFMPTFTFKCQKIEQSRVLSAWESLVRQESILRTTFLTTESEDTPLVQVTFRNPPTQYKWYQSSTTSNAAFVNFLASQEQQKPVSLKHPPVRLTILTTPVETIIFLTIHHALYDGVSLPLLLTKFQGFLEDDAERLPTPDPDVPRFLDFVAFAHFQDAQKQSHFWKGYLGGAVSTLVPLNNPDVQYPGRTEVFRSGVLSNVSRLESHCRIEGVSLHSVFLAAYAKIYSYHLGLHDGPVKQREDVVFGIYLSNRHLPVSSLSSMAAPTLNIVPLRINSPRTTSLIQLARQIQADLVEIGNACNGVVGLWQIEKWTGVQVDCFFNFLKLPGGPVQDHSYELSIGKDRIVLEEVKVDIKPRIGIKNIEVISRKPWMEGTKTNLDIEVAVRGDQVDIGVFSSEKNFSNEDAVNTIEWMCDIVTGIL